MDDLRPKKVVNLTSHAYLDLAKGGAALCHGFSRGRCGPAGKDLFNLVANFGMPPHTTLHGLSAQGKMASNHSSFGCILTPQLLLPFSCPSYSIHFSRCLYHLENRRWKAVQGFTDQASAERRVTDKQWRGAGWARADAQQ